MPRAARFRWDEIALDAVTDTVSRKAVGGNTLELVQVYYKKGTVVPWHQDASERLVYILQGALRFGFDQDEQTIREGEVLVVPAGLPHQVESLDDTFVMVVGMKTDTGG